MDPVYLTAWLATLLFLGCRFRFSCFPAVLWDRVGAICLWIHIWVSYSNAHRWSHLAAVQHVAERTEEMTGIRTGAGIYLNFLVALCWTWLAMLPQQVAASSRDRSSVRRSWAARSQVVLQVFLGLMFFSASVVFADPTSAMCFSILWLLLVFRLGQLFRRTRTLHDAAD